MKAFQWIHGKISYGDMNFCQHPEFTSFLSLIKEKACHFRMLQRKTLVLDANAKIYRCLAHIWQIQTKLRVLFHNTCLLGACERRLRYGRLLMRVPPTVMIYIIYSNAQHTIYKILVLHKNPLVQEKRKHQKLLWWICGECLYIEIWMAAIRATVGNTPCAMSEKSVQIYWPSKRENDFCWKRRCWTQPNDILSDALNE